MHSNSETNTANPRIPVKTRKLGILKRLILFAIVAVLILIVSTPVLHLTIWTGVLIGGNVWQSYLRPGSLPEYDGVFLRLNDTQVETLNFGFDGTIPPDYYLLVDDVPKRLANIKPSDLISLGMSTDPKPIFGDLSVELGTTKFLSFAEFKNQNLFVMSIKHSRFKFSKTADGPFFSLPIAFDEYQKIFGKPLRWKREVSGKRVP